MNAMELLLGALTDRMQGVSDAPTFADQQTPADREAFRKTLDQVLERVSSRQVSRPTFATQPPISGSRLGTDRAAASDQAATRVKTERAQFHGPARNVETDAAKLSNDNEAEAETGIVANTQQASQTTESTNRPDKNSSSQNPDTAKDDLASSETQDQQILDLLAKILLIIAAQQNVQADDTKKNADQGQNEFATLLESIGSLDNGGNNPNAALAKLFAVLQQTNGQQASMPETLNVDMLMERSSALFNILQGLLNADAETMKDAQLLIKVSEDKGLLLPIESLMEGTAAEDADAISAALNLTETTNGKTAAFTLKLSAEELAKAAVVDLAGVNLPEDAAMLVVNNTNGKAEDLLAKLDEQSKNNLIRVQLAEEVKSAGETAQQPLPKVIVPLMNAGKPAVNAPAPTTLTTDAMFMTSSQYQDVLKARAVQEEAALALSLKKLAGKSSNAGTQSVVDLFSKMVSEKQAKSFFVQHADTQNDTADSKQQQQDRTAESSFLKATAPAINTTAHAELSDISGRISILSRPAVDSNPVQQALNTTPAHAPRGDMAEQVMRQVMDHVSVSMTNGREGEVRIFLRPDNLGDMRLKIQTDGDVVTAKFVATSHQVKEILEANMNQLRDALAQQGLKTVRMEVSVDSGYRGDQPGEQQRSENGGTNTASTNAPAEVSNAYDESGIFDGGFLYGAGPARSSLASRINYFA